MAYGMQCWDGSGNIILDTTTVTSRLVYFIIASGGSSGSKNLPEIEGESVIYFSLLNDSGDKISHSVEKNGTEISWTPNSADEAPSGDSLIMVFIHD